MRRRSARVEPDTDADVGQLSAEFAQVILQVIAIAQRKYYSKIAALESKVSELRLSNQALELELAQVKSRVPESQVTTATPRPPSTAPGVALQAWPRRFARHRRTARADPVESGWTESRPGATRGNGGYELSAGQ